MSKSSSSDAITLNNGLKALNLEKNASFLFVAIANRLSRGASSLYRERFGIGVVEWRCMVMLAIEEGVSAARIGEVSGINKSLVSRSLAKLEEQKLIEPYKHSKSLKPRLLQFSKSGRKLYEEVVEMAIARENELLKGLSSKDIASLFRILNTMFNNVQDLDELNYHVDL